MGIVLSTDEYLLYMKSNKCVTALP
eukprot:SAG11_NODE_36040_length_263_cov_1.804878_1_plen_24_part_01